MQEAGEGALEQRPGVHLAANAGLGNVQPGKPMQSGHVEGFHARLRDECLNASWFRTLNDARTTLASWRREFHCGRPHSSLDFGTPEEFRPKAADADVESNTHFRHPHSHDYDGCEIISKRDQNRETPAISGGEIGDKSTRTRSSGQNFLE
jgi:hypothetical protein